MIILVFGKCRLVGAGSFKNPLFSRDFKTFCDLELFCKVLNVLVYKGVREMLVKSRDLGCLGRVCVGMGL